jgi:hypothetical protein
MSTRHRLRASDADRHRVVTVLQQHTAAGRLSLDEFSDRVDQALLARTYGELEAVVRDLPADPGAGSGPGPDLAANARHLAIAFLLALLALVVIGVAIAAFR